MPSSPLEKVLILVHNLKATTSSSITTTSLHSTCNMYRLLTIAFTAALCCTCTLARPDQYDAAAETRNYKSDLKEDGSYNYRYETSNGIAAGESGVGGYYASGSSAYYAPDGQLIQLSYTADENGFHPSGAHLPTPPPIPEAILKALEYIRTHPHQEDRQGGGSAQQQQQQPQFQRQPTQPQPPQQFFKQSPNFFQGKKF